MKASEAPRASVASMIVAPPAARPRSPRRPRRSMGPLLVGTALLLLALTGSWAGRRRLDRFETQIDADALRTARSVLDRSLEQERRHLLSQVAVLAEDNRIRATVTMTNPDEATIRDVLADLKNSSQAKLLAVLDVAGKVLAVVGVDGLREMALGHSTVVKAAVEQPAGYIWTFPTEVLTVGVAPVRSRGQLQAFLVMGLEATANVLGAVRATPGVENAVFIGDKLIAGSSNDPVALQALRAGAKREDERDTVLETGREFLSRVTRINEAVGAAKVVWIVPAHHQAARAAVLAVSIWIPALAAFLMWLVLLAAHRRRDDEPPDGEPT